MSEQALDVDVSGPEASALLGWYEDWTSDPERALELTGKRRARPAKVRAAANYDEQLRGLLGAIHQPGVSLVLTGDGARVLLPSDGLFDPGQCNLSLPGEAAIDGLTPAFVSYPALRLQVEAHTDSSTPVHTGRSRWDLGFERAAAVTERLVTGGVARARVMGLSFADTRPLASNDSELGRARNRRIEILVLWPNGRRLV